MTDSKVRPSEEKGNGLPVSHSATSENEPPERDGQQISRTPARTVVPCPECHELCVWCAWYRKNARECGCGLSVPTGYGRPTKRRCEWGEAAKGVPCGTCDGSGKVLATITYSRLEGR